MHDHSSMVTARLRRALREQIGPARFPARVPLAVAAWEVDGEPVDVEVARSATFETFAAGTAWGRPWGTTWFRFSGSVPEEFAGRRVVARLDLGFSNMTGFQCEGMVWAPSESGRYTPLRGLHPLHHDVLISDGATPGAEVSLLVEAASNPELVWHRPDANSDIDTAGNDPIYTLTAADLVVVDVEVDALWEDIAVVRGLRDQLGESDARRHELSAALSDSLDALDLTDVAATAAAARHELAEVLSRPATPSAHRVMAVGHAHIDTAWLWPLRETVRKCARTFSNVDALMEDYPELTFACSQAQQYAWIEEHYPELFERIRARVAEGRWLPVGGMWVEADANLAGGEALLRQFMWGQRYFEEHFGVRSTEVWIPDVFGYPANLPQIMRLAGIDRFLTQKLSWNETNDFPHHSFLWEGIDGSTVFTHFPPVETYNADFSPRELVFSATNFRDKGRSNVSLMPFGWGDGGGGPTVQMMERFRRSRDLEGFPRLEISSPRQFFDAAIAEYPDAARWVGELYFEKHRGTFTSQASTKAGNRRCERLLRDAELFSTLAFAGDGRYPHQALAEAWRVVLVNQFHDILPGSSIGWVHREAAESYDEVAGVLEGLIADALDALAAACPDVVEGEIAIAGASPDDRVEVVELDAAFASGSGSQALSNGRHAVLATVPSSSVGPLRVVDPQHPVAVSERTLDNGLVSLRLDESGHVCSLIDATTGREAIVAGSAGGTLQLLDDHPAEFDAWDISEAGDRRRRELTDVDRIEIIDSGPLVGSIRVTRSDGPSTFSQTYRLTADSRRLDMMFDIDWHHRQTLLKLAFPLDLNATELTREIQFGHYSSAIHTNTTWDTARFEVCAHRWAGVSEPGFGVALLNDAKYGYDAQRIRSGDDRPATLLRLSLLRGTSYPDPVADEGRHRFTASLLVHSGDPIAAGVVSEAYALAGPPRVVTATRPPNSGDSTAMMVAPSVVDMAATVVVEVVKAADDASGDIVLRCYEFGGSRATVAIGPLGAVSAVSECTIYEEPVAGGAIDVVDGHFQVEFRPFEVRSFRLRST